MQNEYVLRELMSYRIEHYRDYHKHYCPDDDWDGDSYPEEDLYTNEQERAEIEYALSTQTSRHEPRIATLYSLTSCPCSIHCQCDRTFYWYYTCFLLNECHCVESCLEKLPCRHIYCKHDYY